MKKLIQVCGDPTVDWLKIHSEDIIVRGGVYYWQKHQENSRVRLSAKTGGSAMLYQLLREMIPQELANVEGILLDDELLHRPEDNRITTSWTVWKEFSNTDSPNAFRIEKWHEFEPGNWDYLSGKLIGYPDLLIIQDSNLGFRNCREGWPEVLEGNTEKMPEDIIVKLGQYTDGHKNPLLERIMELGFADRTTIVTTLSDLRSCAVKIGISLSWERMFEEIVSAVLSSNCPFLNQAGTGIKYKQVIVTIGASGAVIIDNYKKVLIFDRSGQEGDFGNKYPGQMMGCNTCLLGALAIAWCEKNGQVNWTETTRIGVELARILHMQGYDVVERENANYLEFPYETISNAYQHLSRRYKDENILNISDTSNMGVFISENTGMRNKLDGVNWTILETTLLQEQYKGYYLQEPQSTKVVHECARDIVVKGPLEALLNVPVETIGGWSSADRQEIEGVRSVNNAMRDYLQLKNPDTPLCVAVFGPPGSGKSFVVKEMAKGLGISEDAQLTFNLSQFESPDELQNAFHQVRDLNLKGKLPLVFWDEFDTPYEGQMLGWLRYFLAPMQDGQFTDQGTPRPLGGGIYVFAGATRYSFEEFRAGDNLEDRSAKKPDFISRLRAYIDIRGINGDPNTVEDRLFMIRRAFILRQYLQTNAPQIKTDNNHFEIEAGVLDAFLRVTKYSHGARSLENLVKMSSITDKGKYELSSLPPDHIIAMHVNVQEFNALTCFGNGDMLRIGITGHINLDPKQIDKILQAITKTIVFIEQQFPEHYLTVFSSLAVGADRLAARELLRRDASRLIAVLPVPQEEYINDFGSTDDYRVDNQGAELRQEFKYWLSHRAIEVIEMSPSPTRKSAYLKSGFFIAEHSDILIAVWDGQSQSNSSTAQVVNKVEELNKPVCHIWAGNYKSDLSCKTVAEKYGEVRYKNFPGQIPGKWLEIS